MSSTRTWSQRERRYRPDRAGAKLVLSTLARNLPAIVYQPGATINMVVTTYLDTVDRHYLGIADASDGRRSVKVRIREYLASAAVGARFWFHDSCYLERKERIGEMRLKQRVQIAKNDVSAILTGKLRLHDSTEATAIATELDALDLAPALVSAYERRVFGYDPGLRVTYDERLAYHSPPTGLYDDAEALQPSLLGRPPARGPSRILEIKYPAEMALPAWLEEVLVPIARADGFSKFRDGMHALADADGFPVSLTRPISIVDIE